MSTASIADICDLDRWLDTAQAATLLGYRPVSVTYLCRRGSLSARCTGRGHNHGGGWVDIDLLSILLYSAARQIDKYHPKPPPPEALLASLPARCPRCGILSSGLCADCRADLAGRPYYERRHHE
jgi:hypothetical protein